MFGDKIYDLGPVTFSCVSQFYILELSFLVTFSFILMSINFFFLFFNIILHKGDRLPMDMDFQGTQHVLCRGGSRIFFRRGCTRLFLYFNTNKPHSFFFQNTSCIRKPQVISGGGVRTPCTLPLDPPPLCFR